ncbi:MAG: undecaprenyldiphospho-muramoylpentapeptide beta-N-acetylglucosaminyltransferase [Desulfobacteraceae bacterium]|nr:undecaprenyldiphospho-muramoylpentapeptide beta-N-acetylglucosaminyltransferase [Desulfobacteraceae bacterium]
MNTTGNTVFNRNRADSAGAAVRLVIAGAGTGGHLFPGIAVAESVMQKAPGSRVVFVTTGKPIEQTVLSDCPYETAKISAAGIKGMGLWRKCSSVFLLQKGFAQSMGILGSFGPHAVLGMGGYSSAPVVMAACLRRIPRFIHEQNRLAGMTNRWLARFANRVFVSFADTCIGSEQKTLFTGNPVREQIRACAAARRQRPEGEDENRRFTILVLGGSQGASSINQAMISALSHMADRENCRVIHQTGTRDEAEVRQAYERMGVCATVSAFFRDMASLYEAADLSVCRAGATTVAEIAAVGLPAIFIPYPYAADNHQVANAEGLAGAGAAEIIMESDLSGPGLAECLTAYQKDAGVLEKARFAAQAAGRPEAAARIADEIIAAARLRQNPKVEGQ